MTNFYDDNFGKWENMDEQENRDFYDSVHRRSVWTECTVCGKRVKLLPGYDKCNACADALENGYCF